jgi:hypothetical protein
MASEAGIRKGRVSPFCTVFGEETPGRDLDLSRPPDPTIQRVPIRFEAMARYMVESGGRDEYAPYEVAVARLADDLDVGFDEHAEGFLLPHQRLQLLPVGVQCVVLVVDSVMGGHGSVTRQGLLHGFTFLFDTFPKACHFTLIHFPEPLLPPMARVPVPITASIHRASESD